MNKHNVFIKLTRADWIPLCHLFPCAVLRFHPSDKPSINPEIKDFINKRQRAWLIGHTQICTFYRNKVNKICKEARRIYFTKIILNTQGINPKKCGKIF
jgi:hypothetical protein